jgi:DNA polymerase V
MLPKQIGLIDCNNFFVSCERVFRPDLERQPVMVLSSNDGCVIARSQEIKDMGISMGTPYFQIKDSLKDKGITVFSSNFTLYRDFSARVAQLVRSVFKTVEQYSVDEFFFILEPHIKESELKMITNRIKQEIGIPVSIGVGYSKTQAKYANRVAKRTSGYYLIADSGDVDFSNTPLGDIWGVGSALRRDFSKQGLLTVGDLRAATDWFIESRFGVVGNRLKFELSGQVCYPVTNRVLAKQSYVSGASLSRATNNLTILRAAAAFHVEQVACDLWQSGQRAKEIVLFLYPRQFDRTSSDSWSYKIKLPVPIREVGELQALVTGLLVAKFDRNIFYKKVGIVANKLVADESLTSNLWLNKKVESVSDTVLAINQKLGSVIHIGLCPDKQSVFASRRELLSPAYTTRWSDVRVVRA